MKRPLCENDDCFNLSMTRGRKKDGSFKYDKLCTKHHRIKYGMKQNGHKYSGTELDGFTKKHCQRCGWNESYCDIHRIKNGKDGGKYELKNIIILCPNCHRIEHQGKF